MKQLPWLLCSLFLVSEFAIETKAWALPTPPSAPAKPVLKALDPSWNEIVIRMDYRNITAPDGSGKLTEDFMLGKLAEANRIWAQCGLRFLPRSVVNVSAAELKIPYEPTSRNDLNALAARFNPHGEGAIPLTVAGPWNFTDSESGLILFGLGWVTATSAPPEKVLEVGALVAAQRLPLVWGGQLIAHELGHTLHLFHSTDGTNVMAAGESVTREQCDGARNFAQSVLAAFVAKEASRPVIAEAGQPPTPSSRVN